MKTNPLKQTLTRAILFVALPLLLLFAMPVTSAQAREYHRGRGARHAYVHHGRGFRHGGYAYRRYRHGYWRYRGGHRYWYQGGSYYDGPGGVIINLSL